jgi:hypothetical protein
METMPARMTRRASVNSWATATVCLLAAYFAINAVLELIKLHQGNGVTKPVVILAALALALSAALAITQARAVCGAAVALMAVGLAGSLPHYLDDITGHPGATGRHLFGVLGIAVSVATLLVAAVATARWKSGHAAA